MGVLKIRRTVPDAMVGIEGSKDSPPPIEGLKLSCKSLSDRIGGNNRSPELVLYWPKNFLNSIEYVMSYGELRELKRQVDECLVKNADAEQKEKTRDEKKLQLEQLKKELGED